MSDVYRRQVAPGQSPAFGGASAEAFGAGVGGAIAHVGEVLERRKREDEAAKAGLEFARISGDIDTIAQTARDNAAAGAAGHSDAIAQQLEERVGPALEAIGDRRVQQVYRQQYAELGARIHGRELAWESGRRVERQVSDFDEAGTQLANAQATNPTADGLAEALTAIDRQGELQISGEDVRHGAVVEQKRKVAAAWGNAMVRTNHAALNDVLDSGVLNPYLTEQDIENLRNGVAIEQRRAEAAARQHAADQEAAAREQVTNFGKRVAAGDTPSDAEFDAIAAVAAQISDQGGRAFDVTVWRSQVNVNRETRDWTPAQFDQAIGALRAKGDKRTTAENVQLQQLEQIAGPRSSEFNADPHAWAANQGNPAPAIDNPQARVTWARALRRSAGLGYTPYLSAAEAEPMKDRLASGGAAGLVEVAGQLRNTFGAGVGAEIARQWGNNKDLELMVGLDRSTAARVARGAAVLDRKPALKSDVDNAETFNDVFDEVAAAIPAEFRGAVFDAAVKLWAARADEVHTDRATAEGFRSHIAVAMGRLGGAGGLGEWRDHPLWLPPGLSQEALEAKLTRATPEQIVAAAGGSGPAYAGPDGKPGRIIDFRNAAHDGTYLETVAPGVYRLRDARGGVFLAKDGKPWQIDVRRLP